MPRNFGVRGGSDNEPRKPEIPPVGGFGFRGSGEARGEQFAVTPKKTVSGFRAPTNLSVSQIENWQRCPLGWYGRSVAKWPQQIDGRMARGRVLHSAFEIHHKRGDVELELLKLWRDAVSQGVTLTYAQAMAVLAKYQRSNPAQPNDKPEVRFKLPIPGIDPVCLLWGYMDLVRGSELHEMKTVERLVTAKGVRKWTQEFVDAEIQASAYAWAFSVLFDRLPRQIVYHVIPLDGADPIRLRTYRTEAQIGEFLELARRVYREITSGQPIEPRCPPSRCYYREQCAAYRGSASADGDGTTGGILAPAPEWPSLRVD